MLESLHIRNLALVASLDQEFTGGLNVITGETGAGKSLIIGALQLLAGGRAHPSLIRRGCTSCEAAAVIAIPGARFPELSAALAAKLDAAGLPPCEEGRLLLRRVITESGSRAYVNSTPVTIGFLKDLGDLLIDIHGPHDNQSLLLSSRQLHLLDTYAQDQPLLEDCQNLHDQLVSIRKQLQQLANDGLNPEQADLLRHQLREIKDAALTPGEDEELIRKYRFAENSRRIIEIASGASQALANADHSLLDQVGDVLRTLRELETLDPDEGPQFPEQLLNVYEQLQTLATNLADYAANVNLQPDDFIALEQRLELVQKLKRKYGPSLIDVFETQARIREQLQRILGRGDLIQTLRQQQSEKTEMLRNACAKLAKARRDAAQPLAQAIQDKLRHLGFNKAAFDIQLTETTPGPNGADIAEFRFAPNVGEDLQPLRNTASSGETARVMLAIKTVLSAADAIPILVFDEIDANVGGRVAGAVAQELRAVAARHQVFSISHLPQIAAAATCHYLVDKSVHDGRTLTSMTRLDHSQRLDELIRMLGADPASTPARQHAEELIKAANGND